MRSPVLSVEPHVARGRDRTAIAVGDDIDEAEWAARFDVTRAQLEEAISAVGPEASSVEAYLRGQGNAD